MIKNKGKTIKCNILNPENLKAAEEKKIEILISILKENKSKGKARIYYPE